MVDYADLARAIHADNVLAGWWTDLRTGAKLDRNIGELLCLVHSEISEAWEGYAGQKMDDKLVMIPMFQVELADTAIRVFDIEGYFDSIHGKANFLPSEAFDLPEGWIEVNDLIVLMHYQVSQAMEGFRKGNILKGRMHLSWLLDTLFFAAKQEKFDLLTVIQAKRAYNRDRLDHKPENRKLADGKKF